MGPSISRRRMMQAIGAAAFAPSGISAGTLQSHDVATTSPAGWCPEGPDTPKLSMAISHDADRTSMRRLKQVGINHVNTSGPRIPWTESRIRSIRDSLMSEGLALSNMMISGFPNTIYGRPGRDEEIENIQKSIRAAGRVGVPVVEYNFYAHRLVEGYYAKVGRGGAGLSGFDYERVKNLPPLPSQGAHTDAEMWSNITYFLKAVIPVAEESNVRLALHPNDPPAPLSRGSQQIMGTLEGWKHLIEIVPSKSNGITFDCGVTREMGHDPVEVCRYFGTRDRINHMHFRNVRVQVPHLEYTEVFPDNGQNNMFAVMKELVRQKYPRLIFPEHPRGLDVDSLITTRPPNSPGVGGYVGYVYNVAYARAMLQAALVSS